MRRPASPQQRDAGDIVELRATPRMGAHGVFDPGDPRRRVASLAGGEEIASRSSPNSAWAWFSASVTPSV